jgi:hypothetical protein
MRHSLVPLAVVSTLFTFAVACSRESPTFKAVDELTGSREERIATMTKTLGARADLPGEILDAWFVVEQIGDGDFGPSDFRAFCVLQVRSEDVESWERLMKPLDETALYVAPQSPRSWWMSEEEFQHLRFHGAGPLASSLHGWAAVAPDSARIYVFSFSM